MQGYFGEYGYYIAGISFAGLLFFLYKYLRTLHKDQNKLARLALFPQQNPNPVIEINFDGEATYMNPAALKRFPDMKKMGLEHPLFQKMRSNLDSLRDNESFNCEIELGTEIYEQKIYTIGESKLWRIYSSDITAQKQTERKLANLALFPEQNPNPVIEISFNGNVSYMNPAALRRFPDMKEKGLHHPIFQKIRSGLHNSENHQNFNCEIELGDTIYEQKVYTLQESKLWRVYSSDITQQKQTERKLANLALFPEQNPNPVIEVDIRNKITYMNPAALSRFPDMAEAGLNHPLFDTIRNELPRFRNNEIQTLQCEIVVGKETYEQKVYAIPNGNILRVYSSDVSERKRNEETIRKKNKDITDSINYARRLQYSILPDDKTILSCLPQSFILYKPKDIVSGDFYWFHHKPDSPQCFIAAVDCTGHGVPGAFMSMIGNFHLSSIILEQGLTDVSEILNMLDKKVCASLKQESEDAMTKDGMEISLCLIDTEKRELNFTSAMRPLYLIRAGELSEIKGNKFSIGGYVPDKAFVSHTISLNPGDTFYLTSDGYADQTGGENGKKFMTKKLKELLLSMQSHPMSAQKKMLEEEFEKWKGMHEQVDDMMIIGIRMI